MEAMVIGGGVAGPVAAIALRRVGWDVTVYEAYPDPAGDASYTVTSQPIRRSATAATGPATPPPMTMASMPALLSESVFGELRFSFTGCYGRSSSAGA